MYRFEELETDYGYPIEGKIVHFLEFYNIKKENIINIRIVNSSKATIIFDTDGTDYDIIQEKRNDAIIREALV
jgi:hypothetical protein